MVSQADLHWAAGLFEGEGTITIALRSSDETYRLVVTMGNTDPEVVAFFQDRWPSWVQPAYGERPGRKPAWTWTAAGPRAEAFVRAIQPYLRTARVRAKAELALAFRGAQGQPGRRKYGHTEIQRRLYAAMRVLNRRGVEVVAA